MDGLISITSVLISICDLTHTNLEHMVEIQTCWCGTSTQRLHGQLLPLTLHGVRLMSNVRWSHERCVLQSFEV